MPNSASANSGWNTVAFLGHVISKDGIQVDPAKVEAKASWKQLETVTEIRSFLRFAGYYLSSLMGFLLWQLL
jgi:hypothetical protein